MPLSLSTTHNSLIFVNTFKTIELVKNSITYQINYENEIIEITGVSKEYEEEEFFLYGKLVYSGISSFSGLTDPNSLPSTSQNFQELVLFVKDFVDVENVTGERVKELLDEYFGSSSWSSSGSVIWGSIGGDPANQADIQAELDLKASLSDVSGSGIENTLDNYFGNTLWKSRGYNDILPATISLLEDDSNWTLSNVYDTVSSPSIDISDLEQGKKHESSGVIYECVYSSSGNYWVRSGNRKPISLDFKLGIESEDAVADELSPVISYRLPYDMYVKNVFVACGIEGPTGSSAIIDVHSSGTTIFSATKAEIADGASTADQNTLSTVSISKGTLIELFVDQVGSTTAGKGYSISIQGFLIY